jgi:hypothetical protein
MHETCRNIQFKCRKSALFSIPVFDFTKFFATAVGFWPRG